MVVVGKTFMEILHMGIKSIKIFQIIRWLLPIWAMAAIFDTENNQCSQDDYIAPVFAVNDDSGVS